jgi:hypothetical protein
MGLNRDLGNIPEVVTVSGNNVGIGTTNPTSVSSFQRVLEVNGASFGTIRSTSGNVRTSLTANSPSNLAFLGTETNHPFLFATNDTERMRITSGGDVLVGLTSSTVSGAASRIGILMSGGVNFGISIVNSNSNTAAAINFANSSLGQVGSISYTNSSVSYNTTSDYRLKQDLKPINGLDLVSQIKVYDYEWKSDQTRSYGVLAHELQEVIPQAVNGEKDAEKMQSVDYSKLVPILVQAIQEVKAEIEILKQQNK